MDRCWTGEEHVLPSLVFVRALERGRSREVITLLYTLPLLVVVEFLSWISKVSRGNLLNLEFKLVDFSRL